MPSLSSLIHSFIRYLLRCLICDKHVQSPRDELVNQIILPELVKIYNLIERELN